MNNKLYILIEIALSGGKLSRKDRSTILKKARDLGYEENEIELILDSKLKEIRNKNRKVFIGKYGQSIFVVLLNIVLFGALIIGANWDSINGYFQSKRLGCNNIDDCLSKYKFEEARKYASEVNERDKSEMTYQVIVTECEYWISQNEFEKARIVSRDLLLLHVQEHDASRFGNSDIYKEDRDKKYYEINIAIIEKLCLQNQFSQANKIAYQLPSETVNHKTIVVGNRKDEYISKKNILRPNQEIEQWNGSSGYYKITTYDSPRKEALKIIDDYKNHLK